MSHTAATWHVVRHAVSSYHIVTDGDAGPVASVPTDHPDALANARLIAASPELLEAAIFAENWLAGVSVNDMPDTPLEPRGFGPTYSKLYAAIAKVRAEV